MYYLGVEFYTWTVFLDTKTVTKTTSDDKGQITPGFLSTTEDLNTMKDGKKYTGASSNKFSDSCLPGGFSLLSQTCSSSGTQ